MSSSKGISLGILGMGALSAVFGIPLVIAIAVSGVSTSVCNSASNVEFSELTGKPAQDYLAGFTEQQRNAKFSLIKEIYLAGAERSKPASPQAIKVVIATGIQESELENLDYGDRDSGGFLQMRPSQGWGTPAQVRDPYYATNGFLDKYDKLPGAETMSMKDVALAIQNPSLSAYQRWNWDRTAAELYEMAIGQNGNASCQQSTEWQSPLQSSYSLTDSFGMRYLAGQPRPRMHWGLDFAAKSGTPIYAAHAGVIDYVAPKGTFGNYVHILHDNDMETGYAHMSKFVPGMKRGDRVNAGDVIGYVGSTGLSTGSHLHFEVTTQGKRVDPIKFMLEHGVDLKNR